MESLEGRVYFNDVLQDPTNVLPHRHRRCVRIGAEQRFDDRLVDAYEFLVDEPLAAERVIPCELQAIRSCRFDLGVLDQLIQPRIVGRSDHMKMQVHICLFAPHRICGRQSVEALP